MLRTFFVAAAAATLAVAAPAAAQSHGGSHGAMASSDIVETAKAAGSFNTLLTAATQAGLVETLKGEGPFTVFAPTDEAFAKVPKATLEALLADREQLRQVLLYHVVPGKVTSGEVVKLNEAKTVQGSAVKIRTMNGTVMIDGATVVKADVMASNGVIHVIDSVILPPSAAAGSR